MLEDNRKKGRRGEEYACNYLKNNNYKIIKTNYTNINGEIDIIAENKNYIVFIEVKYRKNLSHGYPREAVNYIKQNKIKNTAMQYISENNLNENDFRFDVIEILDKKIEHIKNAFW